MLSYQVPCHVCAGLGHVFLSSVYALMIATLIICPIVLIHAHCPKHVTLKTKIYNTHLERFEIN